jgi:hypothetical protein
LTHVSPDPAIVLGAVREDVRQTLRTAWVDPALEAAAGQPMFLTAAWSAIRPNVGRSFLLLARALRSEAVEAVRLSMVPRDLRRSLDGQVSEEEVRRLQDAARAAHLATAKVQIIVHALHRASRRERIPGTGREEPPVRRGVPEWQRWMSFQPTPEPVRPLLDEATSVLNLPVPPVPLRLFARWPGAVTSLWEQLRSFVGTDVWKGRTLRLRRMVIAGVSTLPHPIELQWTALRSRGFGEDERIRLADVLAEHEAAMPAQTLLAAFAWTALGSPEIGVEA